MIVKPVDLETTTFNKGNCFDERNTVCFVGVGASIWDINYSDEPYGNKLKEIQQEIDEADVLVFCNAKFDLHHLSKLGIKFQHKKIWDCALVDFMLEAQTTPYPSMNKMAEKYGLEQKPDIKSEYWDAGIDTKDIPYDIIADYLQYHDLPTTLAIYNSQVILVNLRSKAFQRLVSLCNQDILVLQEIEYNGLLFDEVECLRLGEEQQLLIDFLRKELYNYHYIPEFNTASGDHLSCLLYGGTIVIPRRELVGVYKTGDRAGEPKYSWREFSYKMPQLIAPLKKTELKKVGYYETGFDVLRTLKPKGEAKKIVDIILQLSKLEKIVGTYYNGLPKLRNTMQWQQGYLHGNLNQVVAATGRLSATKPNMQNFSSEIKIVFKSRFSLTND